MEWKPIESCPKEGMFMAYRPRVKAPCAVFYEGSWPNMVCEPESGKTWIATHWMEIPKPPQKGSTVQGNKIPVVNTSVILTEGVAVHK